MKNYNKEQISLGKKVKLLRKAKKLTQLELAGILDKDVRTIKAIEAGVTNPTLNTIIGLAKGLGVDIKSLF